MKRIIAIVALLLLPMAVGAQTFNVNLDGGAGTGFATIIISGSDINYTIISSGLDPAPDAAELTDGSDTVDLGADFGGTGTASGTVNSASAADMVANPSMWTLNVSNGTDTLSGVLGTGGGAASVEVYFPVAASNPGANQTFWRTDARIVNRSGEAATATLEFYANDDGGNTEPDATETVDVDINEQLVLEDFLVNLFGFNTAQGAVNVAVDPFVDADVVAGGFREPANIGREGDDALPQFVPLVEVGRLDRRPAEPRQGDGRCQGQDDLEEAAHSTRSRLTGRPTGSSAPVARCSLVPDGASGGAPPGIASEVTR